MIRPSRRQLAAIMFTDMVGYTALMQEDEVRAKGNRDRHRGVLERSVERHDGRVLQYYGDGTLCIFGSAVEAVEAGVEIQQEMQREPVIPLRIGIHSGDIAHDDDGVYGDGVNVASRIESLAIPGAVLVSGKVQDELRAHPTFVTHSLGHFALKNVFFPMEVFAVGREGLVVPGRDELRAGKQEVKSSVAVLPFMNMSADRENEYFSDGITEDLINALTRIKGLMVTSRTSSFAFKAKNEDVREIGRKLGVSRVLEGSVRRDGNRVRVVAQLINTADGYHIWSETYDRTLEDIFAIQDEISGAIANRLREELTTKGEHLSEAGIQGNLEAYNLYLKGRHNYNRWTLDHIRNAIRLYEQAVEMEPEYTLALAGLAECWTLLGASGVPHAVEKASAYAQRALALAPESAEALAATGGVRLFGHWDWQRAHEAFAGAITRNPGFINSYMGCHLVMTARGEFAGALEILGEARRRDPLSLSIIASIGDVLFFQRRYSEALEEYGNILEVDPEFSMGRLGVAWSLYFLDRKAAAAAMFREMKGRPNIVFRDETLEAIALAIEGREESVREVFEEMVRMDAAEPGAMMTLDFLYLYWLMDDREEVLRMLEQGVREKIAPAMFIGVSPLWDSLVAEPRFVALLDSMQLAPLAAARISGPA